MSVHLIYLKDGVKMMRPVLNREEYLRLRNGGQQRSNLSRIRQGEVKLKGDLVQMRDPEGFEDGFDVGMYGYRLQGARGSVGG